MSVNLFPAMQLSTSQVNDSPQGLSTMNVSADGDNGSSLSAAADLIRSIDTAFSEINSHAINAVRDAEEARRNARLASELARRFANGKAAATPEIFRSHRYSPQKLRENKQTSTPSRGEEKPRVGDRLAHAHAEELLALSLELERTNRVLEAEQMSHQDTKSSLSQAQNKNKQLESHIEKLLSDMETQRESYGRQLDALERDLSNARFKAQAAEEDAQVALDLAKKNAASREQLEDWLQRALQEVEMLREHIFTYEAQNRSLISSMPSIEEIDEVSIEEKSQCVARVVRFADEATILSDGAATPQSTRSTDSFASRLSPKFMVATGRQILHRSMTAESESSRSVRTPERSGERRRRLRDRLKSLGAESSTPSPATVASAPPSTSHQNLGTAIGAFDVCRNTAKILKDSGRRLGLSGRWWTGFSSNTADEIHLESLARHYCNSVEVQLNRKQKEIIELESLCDLWEQGTPNEGSHHAGL